jgi:hypothetical protein
MKNPGQAAWANDLEAARTYAKLQITTVGNARGWSADQVAWGHGIVDMYYEEYYSWLGSDVPAFWAALAAHFRDVLDDGHIVLAPGVVTSVPTSLDKLANAFAVAAAAANGAEVADESGDPEALLWGTAKQSAADVGNAAADVAQTTRDVLVTAGDAARALRNRKILGAVVGGTLLVGGGLWLWSRR